MPALILVQYSKNKTLSTRKNRIIIMSFSYLKRGRSKLAYLSCCVLSFLIITTTVGQVIAQQEATTKKADQINDKTAESTGKPSDEAGAEEKTGQPKAIAEDVDLDEPVSKEEIEKAAEDNVTVEDKLAIEKQRDAQNDESEANVTDTNQRSDAAVEDSQALAVSDGVPFELLGKTVKPGTSTRLAWKPKLSFEGIYSSTSVLVVNGVKAGPVLCLTAAVHGDELNGIETVRRILYNLEPEDLAGTVVGVPIVNIQGFQRASRYLTDRRDLNRFFPGDPRGSLASRIAFSFFENIVKHCDALVDLHTGSFYRTNLPQLRGDLSDPNIVKMTKGFGSMAVIQSQGSRGTLRRSAVEAGIPAVTLEAGAPMVLEDSAVTQSVKGIRSLMHKLDMVKKFKLFGDPEPVYLNSAWVRADIGGIIFSKVTLGSYVRKGQVLGTVTDPITNVRSEIHSGHAGRVIGMALNQVVQPGFAAYHIGIKTPDDAVSDPAPVISKKKKASAAEEEMVDPDDQQADE